MGVPWWGWGLMVVVGFVVFVVSSMRAFRRSVREEFVRFVRRERPDWEIEFVDGAFAVRRGPGEEAGKLFPHNLYAMTSEVRANDEEARRPVYEKFLRLMVEAGQCEVDPERDRERLMPRIVTSAHLAELRAGLGEVPAAPLGVEGLHVVAVLDSPESVRYLGATSLAELGLGLAEAIEIGKEHLRKSFGGEVVRRAAETPDLNVVKSFDSHDAARLLLVPEHLHARESVIAMIPDRDTLVLVRPPRGGDWSAMRRLARNAAGPPLWREPIRVTAEGFSAVA